MTRKSARFSGKYVLWRSAQFEGGRFLLCLLLILLMPHLLMAAAVIKGRVFDKDTKEALPSANVFIKGTTMGAASDLEGYYTIYNVPLGKHTLVVSYIGYSTVNIDVMVTGSGTIRQDFALERVVLRGKEVVVTAQAQGQIQAITQQLASDKIANVVSEARIQELPDFNAAQAISRLPGVSTLLSSGEANKVVIRGLAPQYNAVSLEGVRLASTGSTQIGVASQPGTTAGTLNTDRSTDVSMISPYMIKTIALYKSLTPDMDANTIGGTVNMELREAPSELHHDLLWQSGYTRKSGTYDNYRAVASTSKRFFDERLGVYVLGNLEKYDRNSDNMSAAYATASSTIDTTTGYRPVRVNNVALNRHIETRKRLGANLILDYRLRSGSLKSVNVLARLQSDFHDHRTVLNYLDRRIDFTYRGGTNTIDMATNSLDFSQDFRRFSLQLKFASTYSKNSLPDSPYLIYRQTGGTGGEVGINKKPEDLKTQVEYYGPEKTYLTNLNLFASTYKESNQEYSSNLRVPIRVGPIFHGYLKFGGQFRRGDHNNDQETPYGELRRGSQINNAMLDTLVSRFGVDYDPSTGMFTAARFMGDRKLMGAFLDNKFGQFYWAGDPSLPLAMAHYLRTDTNFVNKSTGTNAGGWFEGIFQRLANDYSYVERYSAGYAMAELNLPPVGEVFGLHPFVGALTLVGGIRYEKVTSDYTAYNMRDARSPQDQEQYYDEVTARPGNEFWLPMAQAKLKLFRWLDLRYAYAQSLARPDYHQLSPKFTISYDGGAVWAGNPKLKTAHAYNHDAQLTLHGSKLGLLSVGVFRKKVENFTYYSQYKLHKTAPAGLDSLGSYRITFTGGGFSEPKDGAWLYTYVNGRSPAHVEGIEFDFQTNFWYLPQPLSGLVLGLNYAHMSSDAVYPLRDEKTAPNPNWKPGSREPRFLVFTTDSTREGRLIYQPNDVANAYLGYDLKGFSMRLSFVFQGNSVSYVGAFPEQDGFTNDFFRVDLSMRQKLPWWGLEAFFDAVNLNSRSNMSAQKSIGGFTSVQNYGLVANLGIRYRI
ncbi:MAG: carboxypeptidase-like regulatory domain-containing protein [bacterium]|nr:carboxypeptidase-like regulatory domain-containing protein [candidate division KSB1 bacterium]MDH7560887.1 carboxypeptidase-like regulatory domain-containing protein [bacterium]